MSNSTICDMAITGNILKSVQMRVTIQNWRSGISLYGRNHFQKIWEFCDVFVSPVKNSWIV